MRFGDWFKLCSEIRSILEVLLEFTPLIPLIRLFKGTKFNI